MVFIVQNWGQHPQYTYTSDSTKSTTSMPVALDACHDKKLRRLRDTERVTPNLWAHQPLSVAWPPTDPLPEPSKSYVSNETGFPPHFEGFSLLLLPLPHLPGASDDVVEARLVVMDLCLCHTSVYLVLKNHPKIFVFYYTKIQKSEIFKNIDIPMSP
jgi:hypothetical protein